MNNRDSETVLLIGSSPMMMIKALSLANEGKSVLLLEKKGHIGGAWHTKPLFGYEDVELGFHIIENRKSVYDFLENKCNIELSCEASSSYAVYKKLPIKFSYSLSQFYSYLRRFIKSFFKGDWKSISFNYDKVNMAAKSLSQSYKYPKDGSRGLCNSLYGMLKENNIPVLLGHNVEQLMVSKKENKVYCQTSQGTLEFDKVIFGSRASSEIKMDGNNYFFNKQNRESLGLVLNIKGRKLKNFTCVRMWKDEIMIRVRDVGCFSTPILRDNELLICVQVRKLVKGSVFMDKVLDKLKYYGLIELDSMLLGYSVETYQSESIPDWEVDTLNKALMPSIYCMKTTDLGHELNSILSAKL